MPLNIPDWYEILGTEYYGGNAGAGQWPSDSHRDAYLEHGEGGWVLPHEQLMCRERAPISLSVHEGAAMLKVNDSAAGGQRWSTSMRREGRPAGPAQRCEQSGRRPAL
jgi:hypothetical protein